MEYVFSGLLFFLSLYYSWELSRAWKIWIITLFTSHFTLLYLGKQYYMVRLGYALFDDCVLLLNILCMFYVLYCMVRYYDKVIFAMLVKNDFGTISTWKISFFWYFNFIVAIYAVFFVIYDSWFEDDDDDEEEPEPEPEPTPELSCSLT